MTAKLISFSNPINTNLNSNSNCDNNNESLEDLVCYCARVSNPSNQNITDNNKNDKLLRYLITNLHWSPFEMVSICLEIVTTRDIARQILRHRSFSFQEFSQRYAVVDSSFEVRECRLQDMKNRQNSIKLVKDGTGHECDIQNKQLIDEWREKQTEIFEKVRDTYDWAINNGIAKEQARAILPEGNTPSRMYMNGTLRSWIHYIQLRSGNGTQEEHRIIAIECAKAIGPIFPMITEFVSI
uniref:Thymidylate synthase n=1 Tax=viral metagenome TaxID=1070528 RepID=A0A6C0E4B0_9ZZZZ